MKKHYFDINITYREHLLLNDRFYNVQTKEVKDGFLILNFGGLEEVMVNLDAIKKLEISVSEPEEEYVLDSGRSDRIPWTIPETNKEENKL